MNKQTLSRWLYLFWIYTLVVIAWGAWVRISHSGNGCGEHWPLCNGDFIPDLKVKKTAVEFTHRMMSGLYGLLVIGIFIYFRKHLGLSRKISRFLLVFMTLEALLGALLVKQNLVTVNDSIFRLIVMSLHQLNSFLLTGTAFLLYLSVTQPLKVRVTKLNAGFIILAVSGAIASLAATLFPSTSLWEGIMKDFSSDSHLFVKLRIVHPVLAVTLVTAIIYWLLSRNESKLALKIFVAAVVGFVTLITLSPLALKITHLMLAHYVWSEILRYQLARQHQSV